MRDKKQKKITIENSIEELFFNTTSDVFNILNIYKENLQRSNNNLEKSFFIIGILASINSLYEKFTKKILDQYLFLLKISKKNVKKELKNIISIKYFKQKDLKNFSCKDITEFSFTLKNEVLVNELAKDKFYSEYKAFNKIEDIFYLIVENYSSFFIKENKNLIETFIIDNFKKNSSLTEDEINKKIIFNINFELMYKINQLTEQLKINYKQDRTNIIHGDYRQFEDIYLSKLGNINLMIDNSIVWFCIVYISFKKLIEEIG